MHKKIRGTKKHQKTVLNFLFLSVKKLSCRNDSGPTKLVKIHTAIRTKSNLVGLVKKLNNLNDTKTSSLGPFKLFAFYKKILHGLKSTKGIKTQPSKSTKPLTANENKKICIKNI